MARRKPSDERPLLRQRPERPAHTVKSAMRALEILEYFDDIKGRATVLQVAQALSYPQSSTSALLRTLHIAGYLHYDRWERTYVTSERAAILGSWVGSNFAREGRVIELMRKLNEETGDTIVLASRNGLYAEYIHVVQATSAARLHLSIGTARPLVASGTGLVLLSELSDPEIVRIVTRSNAERIGRETISQRDVLAEVEEIRRLGYSFSTDRVTRGGGMLAAPLMQSGGRSALVIGIGAISANMRESKDELIATLLHHIEAYRSESSERPGVPQSSK